MPRFRPPGPPEPLNLEIAAPKAADVLRPEHFYVGARTDAGMGPYRERRNVLGNLPRAFTRSGSHP